MSWDSRRALSARAKSSMTSRYSTGANLSRKWCSCIRRVKKTSPQSHRAAGRNSSVPFPRAASPVSSASSPSCEGAQRELWLTFLIKFLIYTAYSVTNKTMILWLSKDLGFSDQAAGALVGWVWAPAMTIFTLLAGSLTDAIGLRRTFFLGVAICTVARTRHGRHDDSMARRWRAVFFRSPSARRSARRCCSRRRAAIQPRAQRSISFSIIYAIMNVGYLVAG